MNSANILIAEDNDVSLALMTSILETKGYNITGVADGEQALEAVKAQKFDLALVDLNMEPMGGFAFVSILAAHEIKLPIVIITADESSDVLVRANELGVLKLIQKPVQPDRLIATVERLWERIQR